MKAFIVCLLPFGLLMFSAVPTSTAAVPAAAECTPAFEVAHGALHMCSGSPVEDVLLNRNDDATEKLIDFAEAIKAGTVTLGTGTAEERINAAMLEGMNVLRALFERATAEKNPEILETFLKSGSGAVPAAAEKKNG